MISNLFTDNSLIDELETLLIFEELIEYKKKNGLKLTRDELFFDNYMIKPSSLLNFILRRKKNVI